MVRPLRGVAKSIVVGRLLLLRLPIRLPLGVEPFDAEAGAILALESLSNRLTMRLQVIDKDAPKGMEWYSAAIACGWYRPQMLLLDRVFP